MSQTAAPEGPSARAALSLLERYGGRYGRGVVATAAAVQVALPAAKWLHGRVAHREDFTITVSGEDVIYPDLHEWVLARIPEDDRKALIAATPTGEGGVEIEGEAPPPRVVRLRYDGSKVQEVELAGHRVRVMVERDEIPGGRARLPENWRQLTEKIVFTASSAGGRDAIVRMINGLLEEQRNRGGVPPLFIPSRWGGSWNRRGDMPVRTLESIVLKRGQLGRLQRDLAAFLAAEGEYARVSQPWHRGYLFHGAPGTGKTSVARALANHFGMPMYYLPLGDLEKDADLMLLVSGIGPRSMLLLEDADVFAAATERQDGDANPRASLAAMLNALDGVWTPHGLVTVLTTNYREALDDALVRAGRVDVDEEFTPLDCDQAARLARWFGAEVDGDEFAGRSPAAMINELRRLGMEESCDGQSAVVA